jgi:hypothetical protein
LDYFPVNATNTELQNKKIKTFSVEKMWGLGTPEDLEKFLKNKI